MRSIRTATLAGDCFDNYIVVASGSHNPTDAEWEENLDLMRSVGDLSKARILVSTIGAAPTPAQRARLNKLTADARPRIALLIDSLVVRAVGTALLWFNPEMKIFSLADIGPALDHLHVVGLDRRRVADRLRMLQLEVAAKATGT